MNTRFKIAAAVLGLVMATGAVGDASAKTIAKTTTKTITATHTIKPAKTIKIAGRHHRLHLTRRGVAPVVIAHRLTPRVKIAHKVIVKRVAKVMPRLIGQKTAMAHRTVTKTTMVR